MRTPAVVGALAVLLGAASCGGADPPSSLDRSAARTASAIQGGTTDSTHTFAVAVVQQVGTSVALCSGVLLAPNLVATARHCVSQLSSTQIDCATSTFAGTLPSTDITVTPLTTIPMTAAGYYSLVPGGILVPPGTSVCGNDIALLILSKNITLPQYVTPVVDPPMTDQQVYTTSYAAIGYGVDSPTDTNGVTAGTRRIKENINLGCIPNDKTFVDCFSFANARQFIAAGEFEGGDGTCEGDSGSGAFDQGSFNAGRWVAFGVLSRGGVNAEGGTCAGAIYTRFDAWASLLTDAANRAATLGNYSPPGWANAAAQPEGGAGAGGSCQANGSACTADTDCCSVNCLSFDDGGTYTCVACDANDACNSGYACQQGVCVLGTRSVAMPNGAGVGAAGSVGGHGGCAVAPPGGVAARRLGWSASGVALGCVVAAMTRRQRRRRGRRSRRTQSHDARTDAGSR